MRALFLIIPLILSACSSSLNVANSNAESVAVTFNGSDGELKRASELAGSECRQYNKLAVLRNVSQMSNGNVASYACIRNGERPQSASIPAL